MRLTFLSVCHLIPSTIIHIRYIHRTIIIHLSNKSHMSIEWMCTWATIYYDCTRGWSTTSWPSFCSCITKPVLSISSPVHILFMLRYKTCTVSVGKVSTSICNLDLQRIPSIFINFRHIGTWSCI